MTKRIEVFEGSIRDIEELTGKKYTAIKDKEGNLVQILTGLCRETHDVRRCLESRAREYKADAVVNVTYNSDRGNVRGSGYLVKEKIRLPTVSPWIG